MSEEELRQEIAVLLFQKEKLTLARASRLAGMDRLQFQHLIASRQIPVHYDESDFDEDLTTLIELLDVVALTEDLPVQRLRRGQVGTIVEVLRPGVYEVEFSDNEGRRYAQLAL